jgi:hypothetical protein
MRLPPAILTGRILSTTIADRDLIERHVERPLKHLNHKSDYCPAFKHNWVRVLARAAGVPDGQLVPVQLPLAGENVGRLARAGQ